MRLLKLFIAACLLLSACASGPKFSPLAEPSNSQALIYLYRPAKLANATTSPPLIINGTETINITNGGYTSAYLEPGPFFLELGFGKPVNPNKKNRIILLAGRTYYFKINTSITDYNQKRYVRFGIRLMPESRGLEEIAKTRFIGKLIP